jgi:hypothetical protein
LALADADSATPGLCEPEPELRQLWHRLNNQLSVILAHGELLELKAVDGYSRSRAAQVVTGTLGAMSTVKAIRESLEPPVA